MSGTEVSRNGPRPDALIVAADDLVIEFALESVVDDSCEHPALNVAPPPADSNDVVLIVPSDDETDGVLVGGPSAALMPAAGHPEGPPASNLTAVAAPAKTDSETHGRAKTVGGSGKGGSTSGSSPASGAGSSSNKSASNKSASNKSTPHKSTPNKSASSKSTPNKSTSDKLTQKVPSPKEPKSGGVAEALPETDTPDSGSVLAPLRVPADAEPTGGVGSKLLHALVGAQLLLLALIPALVWFGYQALLDNDEGQELVNDIQPEDPGFVTAAPTTPVMLGIQVNRARELVGAAMFSLPEPDRGLVTLIPADTVVPSLGGPAQPLREIFSETLGETREINQAALFVSVAVAEGLEIGFVDGVEVLDAQQWERILEPVGPIEVEQVVAITADGGSVISAGRQTLDAADAGAFVNATDPEESSEESLARQRDFFEAWMESVAEAGPGAISGESSAGINVFLTAFAEGDVQVEVLPGKFDPAEETSSTETESEAAEDVDSAEDVDADVDVEDEDGNVNRDEVSSEASDEEDAEVSEPSIPVEPRPYRLDPELASWLATAVPFPRSDSRIPIRLLNATDDPQRHLELVPTLIAAGVQIDFIGNAGANAGATDEPSTVIEYYSETSAEAAESLATLLGRGEVVEVPLADEPVEMTVVVGVDS